MLKLSGHAGKIKIDAVSLGDTVDPVKVADPLRLNQRRCRAPGNAQRLPVHVSPLRVEPGVTDNVKDALAIDSKLVDP